MRRLTLAACVSALIATPASAADLLVDVVIPRHRVAEYHRPYMAFWIQSADGTAVGTAAVWYKQNPAWHRGETWLKDIRQWWRSAGRNLGSPPDAVSGPTRSPGRHQLIVRGAQTPLRTLPSGRYFLVVEAVRERGGHDLVRLPFDWPAKRPVKVSAAGGGELGPVIVTVRP